MSYGNPKQLADFLHILVAMEVDGICLNDDLLLGVRLSFSWYTLYSTPHQPRHEDKPLPQLPLKIPSNVVNGLREREARIIEL